MKIIGATTIAKSDTSLNEKKAGCPINKGLSAKRSMLASDAKKNSEITANHLPDAMLWILIG
ncbi:hypothetical protein GCM10010913_27990 [Paenibacillus aceti]|uniref:Uncharacterized protein n=1 Tax=Paenibacillus aceti TaxID=1820010 RepID=A0ABQ1VXM3_9BACL|nr:hypothetical protein GCM10010913_27990 [Paenibacillus aceti]